MVVFIRRQLPLSFEFEERHDGTSRVATTAAINSGTMCGRKSFICSCSLEDLNSGIGYSKSVSNIKVVAGSKDEATRTFRDSGCFDAVSQLNPAFSRQSSAARNVSCVDSQQKYEFETLEPRNFATFFDQEILEELAA